LVSDVEVTQQGGYAGLKIVSDIAHSVDGLVIGIGDVPVEVTLAGI